MHSPVIMTRKVKQKLEKPATVHYGKMQADILAT